MKKNLIIPCIVLLLAGCGNEREFPPVRKVTGLANTDFVPTLEHAVDLNKNQVYCATLGYAWNEVREIINGRIVIGSEDNDLRLLDETDTYENSLTEDEIDNSAIVENGTIRATSQFSKSLPFEFDFDRNNHDLVFNGRPVQSFGASGYDRDAGPQVKILYYEGDDDFAIKLLPDAKEHEIVLFASSDIKTGSFKTMLGSFHEKIEQHKDIERTDKNSWRYYLQDDDIVSIPVITFNLDKHYETIEGNTIKSNGINFKIEQAYQRIALILDEKGAEVESEAVAEAVEEAIEERPKPKKLIFNKPFLIAFKRVEAESPYLAAWIADAELLMIK